MPTRTRAISRFALTFTAALSILAAGCEGYAKETRMDNTFQPAKVKSVKGASAADIRAAIAKRLDGARPTLITDDQWGHAKELYAHYDGNALWLDGDGLRERRTKTLMTALLNADKDALALDAYPLEDLRRVLTSLRDERAPSAELLAEADVALTTTYVMLGEELLVGQVSPGSVSQDWHIKHTPAQVDSALDQFLRDRDFDVSLTRMRPE